jgi:hypothetical protein
MVVLLDARLSARPPMLGFVVPASAHSTDARKSLCDTCSGPTRRRKFLGA